MAVQKVRHMKRVAQHRFTPQPCYLTSSTHNPAQPRGAALVSPRGGESLSPSDAPTYIHPAIRRGRVAVTIKPDTSARRAQALAEARRAIEDAIAEYHAAEARLMAGGRF